MSTLNAGSESERLEQLQALGFKDEEDYASHQQMLARAEELRKSHGLLEASGPWCVVH